MNRPLLLTIQDAAEMASIGRTKAYQLVRDGEWPSVRVGRSVRVPLDALLKWIDGLNRIEARKVAARAGRRRSISRNRTR